MGFPRRVIEAASRVLQERYADGIDLSDYREIKRFRAELCKITGENPNLAYSQKTIQEIIKANGWSNGSKVIPYSFSKSAQKKTSNRNKDVPVDTALIQELERYRNDYCVWFINRYGNSFESYWKTLKTIFNDASKNGIVDKTFDLSDLRRIRNDLFALPKYPAKLSSARGTYLFALDRFIDFWTKSFPDNAPEEVKPNDAEASVEEEEEPERPEIDPEVKSMLLQDFESRRDDYYHWFVDHYSDSFNDYWQKLETVVDDAIELGILDDFLNDDALEKIETELLLLPKYQSKAFSSKWIYPRAVKRFIQFWNDQSTHEVGTDVEEQGASFDTYKEDFCSWLARQGYSQVTSNDYWEVLKGAIVDAIEFGFIKKSFERDDLNKIKTDLLSLPEYQAEVFHSRADCLFVLKRFTEFLNERSVDSWKIISINTSDEQDDFADEDEHNKQTSQIKERHSKKSLSEKSLSRNNKKTSINDFKIDFYFWLKERDHSLTSCNLYWDSFIGVLTEANKRKLISEPVDVEDLKKLKENFFSLPQYEYNVFTSRPSWIKALDYFIEFWDDFETSADKKKLTESADKQPDEKKQTAHNTSQEARSFFQKYKDGFFNWLVNGGFSPSACELYRNSFEIFINEAFRQKLIADSFNIEDIGRIGTTLFSLPQYQFDVFPHRTNCIYALKYFVKFLKSNSSKQSDDKRSEDENTKDLLIPNMKMNETPSEDDILPFESYRDDYVQWLKRGGFSPSASKLLGSYLEEIIDAAVRNNIIVDSFDSDDLNRIEAELFALPKYQANVFPWRNSYMNALSKFIDFWNEDSDEETSDNAKQIANDDSENETSEKTHSVKFNKWDFTSDLEPFKLEIEKRTVEVSGGWKGLYVAVLELCNHTYKRLFRKFYNRELSDYQNGVRRLPTFFINKPVGGVYVSLSDGKYVNINLTPDMFIDNLKRLLSTCVIYQKDVRAFFYKKVQEETAKAIVRDSEKEEVRKEINKADSPLDKETQGRGADIREKFVEWLGKKIPSKETVEVYQAVLPDLEKFCKKQADPAFVLFETLDSKIIGQFARRERRSFRTTIPPYAFSILNFYKRFLDEHAQLFQSDAKPQTSPVAKIDVAPKEEPVASSVASGGFPTKRLGEPWLEPAKKVIEQVFSDRKICGYAELKNFRRLLQEETDDPSVASMSEMRENALFRALNVSYVESASPDRPRGSLQEAEAQDVQKTVDVSDPQKLNKAVMLVLNKHFCHGIDVHSDYDLRRFREIWRKTPYALNLEDYADDKLGALIVSAGMPFQGRVYTINRKAWTFITETLKKALMDGLPIIYTSTFFERHKKELNQLSCYNYQFLDFLVKKHMMKDLVGYEYRDGRIVREQDEDENETIKNEILRVWSDRKGVNVYWLKNQLQYVPLAIVKKVLEQNDCFENQDDTWYLKLNYAKGQSRSRTSLDSVVSPPPEILINAKRQKERIDKEEFTRIKATLELPRFKHGFRVDEVELYAFRALYADVNGTRCQLADCDLIKSIRAMGFEFDEKIFLISDETKNNVVLEVRKYENQGVNIIYYEELYNSKLYEFFESGIVSPEMLAALLKRLMPEFQYKSKYFTISKENLTASELTKNDINRVWGDSVLQTFDELSIKLPLIPLDKIKFTLSQEAMFIRNSAETYLQADSFETDESEISILLDYINKQCDEYGSVSLDEIPFDNLKAYNPELSESALVACFCRLIDDKFDRNARILTRKGDSKDTRSALTEFCKKQEKCTYEILVGIAEEVAGTVRTSEIIETANSIMVRIDKDNFIADKLINFDIDKIDAALDYIVTNDFIGMREVATFSTFPFCGYGWNLFLLESYCLRFSKKYKYCTRQANSSNSGAIVAKTCERSYHDIMAMAVARSGMELTQEEVFDFLTETGYIERKRYNDINKLIADAEELRERRN